MGSPRTGAYRSTGTGHTATEISDLAVRIGRMAYQNPTWTPTRSDSSPVRDPAELAPAADDLRAVLGAVHHATDALTHVAAADAHSVRQAEADSRLYIATRLLPANYDIPHPYSPAPPSRVEALLTGYDHVTRACTSAIATLDNLALTAGTSSQAFAIARRLCTADQEFHGHWHAPNFGARQEWPSGIGHLRKHRPSGSDLVSGAATSGQGDRYPTPKR